MILEFTTHVELNKKNIRIHEINSIKFPIAYEHIIELQVNLNGWQADCARL